MSRCRNRRVEFSPAGTLSSGKPEKRNSPVHRVSLVPQRDLASAVATPISPLVRTRPEPKSAPLDSSPSVCLRANEVGRDTEERQRRSQTPNLMGWQAPNRREGPGPIPELLAVDESEEEVEEGRVPRTRKFPVGMSADELRTHSLTHIPYHPGCRHCVAGRKRDHRHPLREKGQRQMHTELQSANGASICADYFFPKDRQGETGLTALAVVDAASQFLSAHVVDAKGASAEHIIKQILRDLRKMGHYGTLRVRTDQESSIADVFRAVARERGDSRTVIEHAARSDSKGNGQAEKAVQSIEEMVRTLFLDLQHRCGEELSIHDDFYQWMIEHACDLLNRFHVRKGNLTAWEFIKGKPYTGEVYAFGTPVMHRISGPVQGGVMAERWFDGIWLGLQFTSGEHIGATADGRVVRARAPRCRARAPRCDPGPRTSPPWFLPNRWECRAERGRRR